MDAMNASDFPLLPPSPPGAERCRRCEGVLNKPPLSASYAHDWRQEAQVCRVCSPLYPQSLLKASIDSFTYALRLRTGEEFLFDSCDIVGDWVRLWGAVPCGTRPYYHTERGVDVRLADVVWCLDAPHGS